MHSMHGTACNLAVGLTVNHTVRRAACTAWYMHGTARMHGTACNLAFVLTVGAIDASAQVDIPTVKRSYTACTAPQLHQVFSLSWHTNDRGGDVVWLAVLRYERKCFCAGTCQTEDTGFCPGRAALPRLACKTCVLGISRPTGTIWRLPFDNRPVKISEGRAYLLSLHGPTRSL